MVVHTLCNQVLLQAFVTSDSTSVFQFVGVSNGTYCQVLLHLQKVMIKWVKKWRLHALSYVSFNGMLGV